MKIDELNIAIIRHLQEGRKSFKVIAEDLGVSENTIRSRVGKLEEEGVLDIVGLVDPETIPQHRVVMVGVKLKCCTAWPVPAKPTIAPIDSVAPNSPNPRSRDSRGSRSFARAGPIALITRYDRVIRAALIQNCHREEDSESPTNPRDAIR